MPPSSDELEEFTPAELATGRHQGKAKDCLDGAIPIATIQGTGSESPYVQGYVELQGVVTAHYKGRDSSLHGFFLQSLSADTDERTSEAIFVTPETPLDEVQVGQYVAVVGTVTENEGLTQVLAEKLKSCGQAPLPLPVEVTPSVARAGGFEAFEGMLVSFQKLTVIDTYNLGRYGEVLLSSTGRKWAPNQGGSKELIDEPPLEVLIDDGSDALNADPIVLLGSSTTIRAGDSVDRLTGVLDYRYGSFRVQALKRDPINFQIANPRPSHPLIVGGDIRIASFNLQNYFTTLGERGASSGDERTRQRNKLVSAIIQLDSDIVGLTEIETGPSTLDDLVNGLNLALGADLYERSLDPPNTGGDVIRNALIFRPGRIDAEGDMQADEDPIHNRFPIAQTFSYLGQKFSVIVGHFKSRGGCPESTGNLNLDHGQGCWNHLRSQQSEAIAKFADFVKRLSGSERLILMGDLNSYPAEDPLLILEQAGYHHSLTTVPFDSRYSHIYRGLSGLLDHALTSTSVSVTGATIWHINADEPRALDYRTQYNPPSAYHPDAYRSSDHDPIILGIELIEQ